MKIGRRYNWPGQKERLVYVGYNFSGNGYWHQFEKVDAPGVVWCEVLEKDIGLIEETQQEKAKRVDIYSGMRRTVPINTGRRAEKDAEALRKAQTKRDRKNAKRMEQKNG